ncbi:MAG: DNA polymerase IV, partial [Nitrosopumilaceae archaeon]
EQLLKDALEEQKIMIRRIGVKVSELSDLRDQSSITSYF